MTDTRPGRLVWITEEQRRWLGYLCSTFTGSSRENTETIAEAWDAAPVDPAEAVLKALAVYPWERNKDLVLRALGYPQEKK